MGLTMGRSTIRASTKKANNRETLRASKVTPKEKNWTKPFFKGEAAVLF
jgi:hypothetical protein